MLFRSGYRASDDAYDILLAGDGGTIADRLDFPTGGVWDTLRAASAGDLIHLTDTDSFEGTANQEYPDLFHRIRTGLEALHILYPPQILVSYRRGYVSKGFSMPFGSDISVPASGCRCPPGCHSNNRPVMPTGAPSTRFHVASRIRVVTKPPSDKRATLLK